MFSKTEVTIINAATSFVLAFGVVLLIVGVVMGVTGVVYVTAPIAITWIVASLIAWVLFFLVGRRMFR